MNKKSVSRQEQKSRASGVQEDNRFESRPDKAKDSRHKRKREKHRVLLG